MKSLIILKGLPASGKTTWSKNKIDKNPGMYKRINKDDLRSMMDNGKYSKHNEQLILDIRDYMIVKSLGMGFHVIVDDTNLHSKHEDRIKRLVSNLATVKIKDFTNIPPEICIKRDLKRSNSVGKDVIMNMYNQFIKPVDNTEKYVQNPQLPKAIIVDIDGTLALMGDRSPYDWDKVDIDSVNEPVKNILKLHHKEGHKIIIVSGRDGISKIKTMKWLDENCIPYDNLFMRIAGDNRKDAIIKQELFDKYIKDNFNIEVVYDDRNQVVKLWRSMGIACFQVNDGDF